MPYAISVDEAHSIVRVVVTGTIDTGSAASMVPGDISHTDLFWFPRTLPALSTPAARAIDHEAAALAWMAEAPRP